MRHLEIFTGKFLTHWAEYMEIIEYQPKLDAFNFLN